MNTDSKLTVIAILGGGILLGFLSPTLLILALASAVIGIVLNAYLLAKVAVDRGRPERLPVALTGALPAGLFDAAKIFLIGVIVRWLVR